MKYRLKKDLPFVKAGDSVTVTEDNYVMVNGMNINPVKLNSDFVPQLISEGWIEEVKPRELRVHFGYAGGIIAVYEQSPTADICLYKSGIIPSEDKGNVFREVIE